MREMLISTKTMLLLSGWRFGHASVMHDSNHGEPLKGAYTMRSLLQGNGRIHAGAMKNFVVSIFPEKTR
jgi:hypothetical protein